MLCVSDQVFGCSLSSLCVVVLLCSVLTLLLCVVYPDQVFGCSLSSLCQREGVSVPHFVSMCIDHVENTGRRTHAIAMETHRMRTRAWMLPQEGGMIPGRGGT